MEREDLVRLARYVLTVYAFLIAYVLFRPSAPGPPGLPYADLVGHVLLFFVLGVLVGLSALNLSAVARVRLVLLVGLVVGVSTELVQGLLETRDAAWSDLAGNWFGTMVAGLVVSWRPPIKAFRAG